MEIHSSPQVPECQCPDPECLCQEIAGEVRDMAIALFAGCLSPRLFEKSVIALENAKVKRFGFHLTAERLPGGGSSFKLSTAATGKTCATMDFSPLSQGLETHDLHG